MGEATEPAGKTFCSPPPRVNELSGNDVPCGLGNGVNVALGFGDGAVATVGVGLGAGVIGPDTAPVEPPQPASLWTCAPLFVTFFREGVVDRLPL